MPKLKDFPDLKPGDWIKRGGNLYVMANSHECFWLENPHHGRCGLMTAMRRIAQRFQLTINRI
jgi:hypothetical protein